MTPAPHPDELAAAADLLPQVWEEIVIDTVRGVHEAVADRAFGLLPASDGPRAAHDGLAALVYDTITAATRGTRGLLALLGRATRGIRDPQMLARSIAWRQVHAVVNGLIGAELEETDNPLAIRMALRVHGHDVPLQRDLLSQLHPDPPHRVAVLIHGLTEHDESWDHGRDRRGETYDDLLTDHGVAPLRLRYNSGRHISKNGADLSEWLELLHHAWPVPIHEILLIGHSMGGLVVRSAAEAARLRRHGWPASVRHVVMLGTPHDGAPLEKAANAGAWLLAQMPEMAPFAEILRRRSAGIKDLRVPYLSDSDWDGLDPDAWFSRPAAAVGGVGRAAIHNVGATVTRNPRHPVGVGLGDILVRWDSAIAHGQSWAQQATVTHIGGASHFALLNHPEVALLLMEILGRTPANAPARRRFA